VSANGGAVGSAIGGGVDAVDGSAGFEVDVGTGVGIEVEVGVGFEIGSDMSVVGRTAVTGATVRTDIAVIAWYRSTMRSAPWLSIADGRFMA